MPRDSSGAVDNAKLERWLWCVALYPSVKDAKKAARAGAVQVNGKTVKPAKKLRRDDAVALSDGRTISVLGIPRADADRCRTDEEARQYYCEESSSAGRDASTTPKKKRKKKKSRKSQGGSPAADPHDWAVVGSEGADDDPELEPESEPSLQLVAATTPLAQGTDDDAPEPEGGGTPDAVVGRRDETGRQWSPPQQQLADGRPCPPAKTASPASDADTDEFAAWLDASPQPLSPAEREAVVRQLDRAGQGGGERSVGASGSTTAPAPAPAAAGTASPPPEEATPPTPAGAQRRAEASGESSEVRELRERLAAQAAELEAARSQLDTQSAALAQERPPPAARSQDASAAAEEAGAGAQQVEMARELTQLRERLEEEQRARAAAERVAAQAAQQQTSATPPRTPLKHRLAAEMEVRPACLHNSAVPPHHCVFARHRRQRATRKIRPVPWCERLAHLSRRRRPPPQCPRACRPNPTARPRAAASRKHRQAT